MTEHTHTGKVFTTLGSGQPAVYVSEDWPVGAEVTVTWTEPPEPTGRWVVVTDSNGWSEPRWRGVDGVIYHIGRVDEASDGDMAVAALVDLIESHLPPQMPSVDDIVTWMGRNGYGVPYLTASFRNTVIRGTLDAIAALPQNGAAE